MNRISYSSARVEEAEANVGSHGQMKDSADEFFEEIASQIPPSSETDEGGKNSLFRRFSFLTADDPAKSLDVEVADIEKMIKDDLLGGDSDVSEEALKKLEEEIEQSMDQMDDEELAIALQVPTTNLSQPLAFLTSIERRS